MRTCKVDKDTVSDRERWRGKRQVAEAIAWGKDQDKKEEK